LGDGISTAVRDTIVNLVVAAGIVNPAPGTGVRGWIDDSEIVIPRGDIPEEVVTASVSCGGQASWAGGRH